MRVAKRCPARTRRVHVGPHLTVLFENHETVRYQVQEMMLAERIVRETDVQHELDTYTELLGGPGELSATLLIEIEEPRERDEKLVRWLDLPQPEVVGATRLFVVPNPSPANAHFTLADQTAWYDRVADYLAGCESEPARARP
jgi:hypothetical protein